MPTGPDNSDNRRCDMSELHGQAGLRTVGGEPVTLEGVRVSGDLRGLVLEASVEQRFVNPGDANVEIVYTFPLPASAVLLGVGVRLGDRRLTGAVVEKAQAEARYEETLSEGDAAIMLERNGDASFTLNLGNLMPGESCVVTIRYAQTLRFEQRGLRLTIPTVIAPRYGDPVGDAGLQPHQTTVHDAVVEYPFDIELRLHGDLARARIGSPSHPIAMAFAYCDGADTLAVTLSRRGALDRDFVLVADRLAHGDVGILARDFVEPDAVVALASFCPRVRSSGTLPVAVKLLVDCSGSMAGDSIDAARRALQAIVLQLRDGDRFSLSKFGNRVEHGARGLWSATDVTRLAAQRWVAELDANLGGTEMEAALRSTFALSPTVTSDVLLVTDGEIHAIERTVDAARKSGHRLFVVGIGSSPAEPLLRRLADETGGACDFVAPGEAVEPAVLRMFGRLRSPRVTALSVAWPEGVHPAWVAPLPASAFDGDTIHVFALLPGIPAGEVRLRGAVDGGTAPEDVGCLRFGDVIDAGDTLSRMAASVRLRTVQGASDRATATAQAQLAVAYQLVTDGTNFLLTHARADGEKAVDMPTLRKVAQMVPAGWGATSTVTANRLARPPMFAQAFLARRPDDAPDVLPSIVPAAQYEASSIEFYAALDTPAFLGRSERDDAPLGDRVMDVDPGHPFDRTAGGAGAEFDPLGLREWLRASPPALWPTRHDELVDIGVPLIVADWLAWFMAAPDRAALAERVVVTTFLYAVSRFGDSAATAPGAGPRGPADEGADPIASALAALAALPDALSPWVDPRLLADFAVALAGMSDEAWPASMSTPPGVESGARPRAPIA